MEEDLLNEAKKGLEEKEKAALTVVQTEPGKKYKFICAEHGDVTSALMIISLNDETGSPVQYLYCLHDINKAMMGLQEQGILNKITIQEVTEEEVATTEEVKPDENN